MSNPSILDSLSDEAPKMKREHDASDDEQHRWQLQLDAARARYFGLYDTAPVGHITVSNHGLILQANRTATTMFGMPPDELVTQPITQFIRTDDHDRYRQLATLAFATGDPQSGELWIVRSDGTSVWAHVAITTAPAPDSDVPACRVVVHDITERKQGEADQRDTEARYRRLVETAEEGIWTIDKDSRTDFVNPKMARMLGYTVEEMLERHFHDFMDPAGRAIADNNVKRRQQGIAEQHEFKFLRRDGTELWASLVSNPITSPTGEYLGALAMITDVTARKHAERALRESEEKFRTLFENAGDAIFIMDGERFVDCNVRALEMFGCQSRAQFVELPPYAFSPPQQPNGRDSVAWAVENITAVLAGQSRFFEWVHTRLDGTPFPAEVTLNAVKLGETMLLQGIVRDTTERQQAQINREQLERRMQETQKLESLGVLAGGIAHDFNNLLTSIIGNASLASLEAEPDSALHDYLESITEGSQRAADLCKQMLAYSGRGRFVVRRINLSQLVTETAQMLKLSISKKAVLHFQLEHALPAVEVDATQLRQVIMNLVINASEAIGDQSGIIRLSTGRAHVDRAYLRSTLLAPELPEGHYVFLEVADNGSGMSEDTRARMFDPFFTTKFLGRGLGLAAVLGIIRGHRGTLKVDSEPNRGTTFRLLLPAIDETSDVLPPASPPAERWRGHGEILVVDDEENVRAVAAKMLPLLGFTPVLVTDGREAMALVRADPSRFALVLLDLTMPNMGGEETFLALHQMRDDVRVVLMSGYDQHDALVRFPDNAPAGFLQKPFNLEGLRLVLQYAVG